MRRADYWTIAAVAGLLYLAALAFWSGSGRPRAGYPLPGDDFGYTPDPEGTRDFLMELPQAFFRQAAEEAYEKRVEVDTFLYRSMDKAHRERYGRPFVVGRQGIGDCVAWGAMHAVYCAEAVSWDVGERPDAPLMPASESIYGGSRVEARGRDGSGRSPVGGWSDGSTGWGAAKWLRDWGVVYRESVGGHDLAAYSAKRAKDWGAYGNGGQGDNGRLDAIAKKIPCRHVVAVRTWDELVAAIGSGYPVTIASSVGFNSTRDADGFCIADRTWMHQMCIVAVRFAKTAPRGVQLPRDGALILNSWGPSYVSGGKYPADQPDGSFWATRSTVERILRQNDSYAIGSVAGFAYRDLHNGDWLQPAEGAE